MKIVDKSLDSILFIFDSYLQGKDIRFYIVRILDPLFTIIIAAKIYYIYYLSYEWYDVTDYKRILNFVVGGEFIIPLSIAVIVHFCFIIIPSLIVEYFNNKATIFLDELFKSIRKHEKLYQKIVTIKSKETVNKLDVDELMKSLLFWFKCVFLSITYFIYTPNYGVILFITIILILLFFTFGTWIIYVLFELVPKSISNIERSDDK
jgi:hypothetical protein